MFLTKKTGSSLFLTFQKQAMKTFCSTQEDKEILITNPSPYFTKLTMNRPASLNALTYTMCTTIHELVHQWNKDVNNKIVWFCGKGKAFSAGGDIKALYDVNLTKDPEKMKIHDTFFREEFVCDYKIKTMKPMQISIYDGIVMGGGVGLSIHSKAKVASEATVFAMPEAKIGFFTDVSGSYFLSRLPHNLGLFLGLTGTRLRGAEMVQCGLANFYVPKEKLPILEQDLISKVSRETSDAQIYSIINQYVEKNIGEYPMLNQVKELFQGDSLLDVYRNLENDKKYSDFSKKMLKNMKESSPTSLRIIFEAIKRGKNMSLEDVFKMEFRLTQRFFCMKKHKKFFLLDSCRIRISLKVLDVF